MWLLVSIKLLKIVDIAPLRKLFYQTTPVRHSPFCLLSPSLWLWERSWSGTEHSQSVEFCEKKKSASIRAKIRKRSDSNSVAWPLISTVNSALVISLFHLFQISIRKSNQANTFRSFQEVHATSVSVSKHFWSCFLSFGRDAGHNLRVIKIRFPLEIELHFQVSKHCPPILALHIISVKYM